MDKPSAKQIALIAFVVIALIGAAISLLNYVRSKPTDLSGDVVIRFDDSGEEININRGQFERSVLARAFQQKRVDPKIGIDNPKTGKPTGFPVDRAYWERLVQDANAARDSAEARSKSGGSPTGRPTGP